MRSGQQQCSLCYFGNRGTEYIQASWAFLSPADPSGPQVHLSTSCPSQVLCRQCALWFGSARVKALGVPSTGGCWELMD